MQQRKGVAVIDQRCDARISRRTSRAGHEVFVVDVPGEPAVSAAELLGRVLVGGSASKETRCRVAQRVQVDDAFFELTVDELVDESRSDDAVVVRSSSHLAGIRSLPEPDDSRDAREDELRRLRRELCGHA